MGQEESFVQIFSCILERALTVVELGGQLLSSWALISRKCPHLSVAEWQVTRAAEPAGIRIVVA